MLSCPAGLTSLEWLSLQGCSGMSAGGIYSLQHCRRLRYLDLSGTAVIGLDFLKMHAASHPDSDQVKRDGQPPPSCLKVIPYAMTLAAPVTCVTVEPMSL